MTALRYLALFCLCACSTPKLESTKEKTVEPGQPVTDTSEKSAVYKPIVRSEDSTMFIGFVGHHSNTNEFYVDVYHFADSVDESFYSALALAHDSTIVNDDEVTRTRLKHEVASKTFNLIGLDTIKVFSAAGSELGSAKFVRVEYLDEMIEGNYTAVFKPLGNFTANDDAVYCISKGKPSLTAHTWTWQPLEDAALNKRLLNTFNIDSQQVLKISHIHVGDLNATYSSVSLQRGGTILVETKSGKSFTLMTLKEDYSLGKLQPVHFKSNDRPVFLSAIMPNETDGSFEVLLAFNGENYEMLPGSRARHAGGDVTSFR